jgi:uncharacterized protein (TIGR03067 family)
MTTRIACPLITLAVALAAGGTVDAGKKEEFAPLQGTWKLVSLEADGEMREIPEPPPRWVIKGDKVLYAGGPLADLTLDTMTTPRSVDLHFLKPKKVLEGVYSLDGDTLKVCVNRLTEGVKERPLGFSTKGKSEWRLLVFQREKAGGDGKEGLAGFVGVAIQLNKERKELSLAQVFDGSPAKEAGLKQNDILLKVGAEEAMDLRTVVNLVRQSRPGSNLTFRVRRGDQEREIVVKVGVMPFFLLD